VSADNLFFYTFQNSNTFTNFLIYQAYMVGPVKRAINNKPEKYIPPYLFCFHQS